MRRPARSPRSSHTDSPSTSNSDPSPSPRSTRSKPRRAGNHQTDEKKSHTTPHMKQSLSPKKNIQKHTRTNHEREGISNSNGTNDPSNSRSILPQPTPQPLPSPTIQASVSNQTSTEPVQHFGKNKMLQHKTELEQLQKKELLETKISQEAKKNGNKLYQPPYQRQAAQSTMRRQRMRNSLITSDSGLQQVLGASIKRPSKPILGKPPSLPVPEQTVIFTTTPNPTPIKPQPAATPPILIRPA